MKVLLYATKAKPYLYHTYRLINADNEVNYFGLSNKKLPLEEMHIIRDLLNGKVVGEFEFDEWDLIKPAMNVFNEGLNDTNIYLRGTEWVLPIDEEDYLSKTCLSKEELIEYSKGKDLYAWHIKDFQMLDEPIELGELVKFNKEDKWQPDMNWLKLTKAPQNYQWVYYKGEKCLLLSIHTQHLYNMYLGNKTIEIRKSVPKELR